MAVPGRNGQDLLTVASSGQGKALVASYESVIESAAHSAHAPARDVIRQFESHLRALRSELRKASHAARTGVLGDVQSSVDALRRRIGSLDAISSTLRAQPVVTPSLATRFAELASRFEVRTSLACRVEVHHAGARPSPSDSTGEQTRVALNFVREALDNVARHAHGSCARIGVTHAQDGLTVSVVDNGWGACPASIAAKPQGGIARCRQEIMVLSGHLEVGQGASGGTLITASLPPGRQNSSAGLH